MDEIDRGIVDRLTLDGRASFVDIGARVGLSATAVKRRVERLQQLGVITGFTAIVDANAAGASTEAFVELFCTSRTSAEDVLRAAVKHPEIVGAYTVSGDADAILHLRTPDITSLEAVLQRIRADAHVQRTRSAVVLSKLLERQPPLA